MKLISLNCWGGSQGKIFFDYIKEQSQSTDIFCFQEMFLAKEPAPKESLGARPYLFQELSEILNGFEGYFEPRSTGWDFVKKVDFPISHGLAIFYKTNIIQQPKTKTFLLVKNDVQIDDKVEGDYILQGLNFYFGNRELWVLNYHGMSRPGHKLDTERRLLQSEKIKEVWQGLQGQKILCGDFNLNPETESIKILESLGRNLIRDFKIENTRNEISWANYPDSKQYFADYCFVSPEVKVNSFAVPYNLVSDHLPMVLKIERLKNKNI